MDVHTIEISGRIYENIEALKIRLNVSEYSVLTFTRQGMPGPIKIGRKRYYDREKINEWIIEKNNDTWKAGEASKLDNRE